MQPEQSYHHILYFRGRALFNEEPMHSLSNASLACTSVS